MVGTPRCGAGSAEDRFAARVKDAKPEAPDRRGVLTVPRRAGASGDRLPEVVHVRSGGAIEGRPRRIDAHVHAASWGGRFPAMRAAVAPIPFRPITE